MDLLTRTSGAWQSAHVWPTSRWYSLFFNPQGNFYHARNNLLERLVLEINQGAQPTNLVSYFLVRDMVGSVEFKITVNGEDFLHSPGPETSR
ncbi:MAG: hypothetical protein AB7N80_11180 [Bdellovibrionales bacterium]